ncbi:CTP synthase [Candidatus Phytoplasma australasiaticum subsp. australasiaticum]|uniref:CTP synthase n=2 Tax=16SrII (Peanut WB group) TaxID=85621 RepID=A0A9K3STR4_9MOLU|nr:MULTISPECIES: CTP synthase [Phytoplasma]MCG3566751.1 CTP synthase [Sesame phyllody phytoplasma]MDO8054429.1 CTP synthase [Candidatus Phytoplasma australasiaticum]MDO8058677.1 CTP synthase [Candidatus Phytoplasma australasiaticum]UQV26737.1 CTP synthase ['Parthenium sp.' phyllody phytoplasma]
MQKKTKIIFITGGVVSGLGKGLLASSLGYLLKQRNLKIFMQKLDPYINVDSGTMSPQQHGEVFVTNDGAETDLDLGHYERYLDINLTKDSSITTGQIYQYVIQQERQGNYLGKTIQVIPHITDEIKSRILKNVYSGEYDILIVEIGGTIGDIESLPFIEAIRQVRQDLGFENVLYIHNTLIPFLKFSGEPKTKPTQHSVKELRSLGIQPQILILRSESDISVEIKEKISILCDVKKEAIFSNVNVSIVETIVLNLYAQQIDNFILKFFNLEYLPVANLSEWQQMIQQMKILKKVVKIGIVGKYTAFHDAYLSVVEALKHAAYFNKVGIDIQFIYSEDINSDNVHNFLCDCDGILVPGGFGGRAIEGKLQAIRYARCKNIPFFGICLGMQLAVVEYANNVLNLFGANSTEIDENTPYPVIKCKITDTDMGGTLRLGLKKTKIITSSKSYAIYRKSVISERYRQRYEMNSEYISMFTRDKNFIISGLNLQESIVEIIELVDHIWFIGVQFHPEFLSRPFNPHPLFKDFILTAAIYRQKNKKKCS